MSDVLTQNKLLISKLDFLSISAALCIATIPWSLKLNTLVIIGFGSSLLLYIIFKKGKIRVEPKRFLLGSVVFSVALIWLLSTTDQESGLKFLERSLSALIFPFLFSLIYNRFQLNIRLILRLFMISCLLRYFVFLYEIIDFELVFIFDYWKEVLIQFNQLFKVHGLHPSYFSMFLGFCSLICYDTIFRTKSNLKKSFWIIALLVFFVINLSLAAKMPIVATIISLVLVTLISTLRKSSKTQKTIVASLLVTGVLILGLFLYKVPNPISQDIINYYQLLNGEKAEDIYDYNQYGINSSLTTWEKTNRVHIWKSGIEVVQDNFFLGVGTGDIKQELNNKFSLNKQDYLATKDTNTHNQILDYLIKYGIVGFLLIVCAFTAYFNAAWKNHNQLFLMFLVLSCLCMLTENILNRQYGIVFFFYVNSLFFFYRPTIEKKKLDVRKSA